MPRKNDWQSRFGAIRRAKDKALLAECERQIAIDDKLTAQRGPVWTRVSHSPIVDRAAIARAFGRPVN